MDKRYQIFVSSTYMDLSEERKSVIQTLMEMDCIPSGMELFPAADEDQWQFIKKIIDDCDYYLLIIGGRYGSLTPEGLSYTEKEYEYAKEIGLKIVALIHDKPEDLPRKFADKDPALQIKLQEFRDKVATGRMVKFWNDPKLLPGMVSLSLGKTIRTYPAVGWVRADQVSNVELLNELNELRKDKEQLTNELQFLKSSSSGAIFSEQEEKEFEYIYESLMGFHNGYCTLTNSVNTGKRLTLQYSLLRALRSDSLNSSAFYLQTFLESIKSEVENSSKYQILQREGFSVNEIRAHRAIEGALRTKELFIVSQSPTISGVITTRLAYSSKAYRFLNWLEITGRYADEPKAELGDVLHLSPAQQREYK